MNTYKVSIITVCLNSVVTIRQTIESVLHQTYRDIEYIIVDGGSTDGTLDMIREYELLFRGRMRYVSEKDKGIYDAMNKGIRLSHGELIGIINSDDWYEPEAVELAVHCFQKTDADVVYGEIWIWDGKGEREYHTSQSDFPPHPGTFIRREVYQEHGLFDTCYRIAADRELLLRLMTEGVRFERIDRVFANFRQTGISNMRNYECARETYEIDLKYLGKCPGNILNRDFAEELYERSQLRYIGKSQPRIIREIMEEIDISGGVAIFGAGNCGKEFMIVLRDCGVPIQFFVDNDTSKWGLEFQGIRIYSPEILRDISGHVIVTVTRFQQDICRQLQNYGNPALSWSVLGEIRRNVIRTFVMREEWKA